MEVSEKLHSDDVCKMCEACQFEGLSTNADGLCVDCNDYMCQTCFRHHLKGKTSRNHVLGPLTLEKKETREDSPTKKHCKKHSKEMIKYFCRKHDAVACGDCIVTSDKGCEMDFIKHFSKKLPETNKFRDMMRKIQSLENENTKSDKEREINSTKNKSLAEKALVEIRNFRKEINEHLDRTEAEILADVNRLSKENEDLLSELDEKITKLNHDIAVWKPTLDASQQEEDILFINFVECKPQCSDIERSVNEIQKRNHIASFTFEPDQKMKELLAFRWRLGSLKVVTEVTEESPKNQDKPVTDISHSTVKTQTEVTQKFTTETTEEHISIPQQRYSPPDPRSVGFDVGKRVKYSPLGFLGRLNPKTGRLEFMGDGTVTAVDPKGFVDVTWDGGQKTREKAGAGGMYEVRLIN